MALVLALVIVFVTGGQDPRPQPRDPVRKPASAPATATISGRVTDAESGRPLRNAEISANSLTPPQGEGRPPMFRAVTDEAGRYRLSGLPPDEYRLLVTPGELRATNLPAAYQLKPGAEGPGAVITVAAGDSLTGVDVALPRAFAIEGRLVNERGQPMVLIPVRAHRLDRRGSFGREMRTDDRGRFRIFGLTPGRYRVCAAPRDMIGLPVQMVGDRVDRYATSCYPSSSHDAQPIVISSSDVHGIEIPLPHVGTFTISGEIVDASGTPISGARISAAREEYDEWRAVPVDVLGSRFVVPHATPGDYVIRASRGMPHDSSGERGRTAVRVSTADAAGVEVALVPGVDVRGRLVVDDGQFPLSATGRIRVSWTPLDEYRFAIFSEPMPVAADLRFVLGRIYDPGQFTTSGLPAGWAVSRVIFQGGDVTDRVVKLPAGSGQDDLRIHLTSRTAKLTVRPVDHHGQPAPASVLVMPVDPDRRDGGLRWAREISNRTYDAGSLVPGEYLVAAVDSALAFPPDVRSGPDLARIAAVAERLTLKEGENRTVVIRVVSGEAR